MKRKILFANGRPTPPITFGGDSVSVGILLNYLHKNGYNVNAFGCLNPEYSTRHNTHSTPEIKSILTRMKVEYKYVWDWSHFQIKKFNNHRYLAIKKSIEYSSPYYCKMVRNEFFLEELESFLKQNPPDVIITQADFSSEIILLAKRFNIPVILLIQDMETYNFINIETANSYNKCTVLFISKAVSDRFSPHCKTKKGIWYHPVIVNEGYKTKKQGKHITIVNPILIKGGATFKKITEHFKNEKFLSVTNWYDSSRDGIDFSNSKNISVVKRQDNMDKIYKKTKLLLVPSLWHEAFGRVSIEAGAFGIPTVASNSGGLKEAVGKGGIIIDDFINIDKWISAINIVLRKNSYRKFSRLAYLNAKKFASDKQGKKFETFLK